MVKRERASEPVKVYDNEPVEWVNASGLPDVVVESSVREVAAQLTKWVTQQRAVTNRSSLFDRGAYAAPDNPYEQLRIARNAVDNDDVVGGTADVVEGLMFQGLHWESEVADDADIFNQVATDLNLDSFVRAASRELYATSQLIVAEWWAWRDYTVRGRTPPEKPALEEHTDLTTGVVTYVEPLDPVTHRPLKPGRGIKRKKKYRVWVPTKLVILDATKVVPVGNPIWGYDRLAWQATRAEMAAMDSEEALGDPTMQRLFVGVYTPSKDEAGELAEMGIDPERLLLLNEEFVWRHVLTKSDYQRFPSVRLKRAFRLLDLKQQLIESDRVTLIGASNYILLVKKGSDTDPAYPEEISNLKENFDVVAKLPVIVSDHRLSIEIITPKTDYVLQQEKYDIIDRRLISTCLGSLAVASSGQRNESTLTTGRMVGRLLESRRLLLKRVLEERIARKVCEHPLNAGKFEDEPNLAFVPRQIQLDNDQQIVQAVIGARAQKELSRQSFLEFLGFDQEVEAQRRLYEEEAGLDDIFQTQVPYSTPSGGNEGGMPPPPQVTGPQGGRPTGGGSPTQDTTKPRRRNRTPGGA